MSSVAAQQTPLREDLAHFECWALTMLRCELEHDGPEVWKVKLPETLRGEWSGDEVFHFRAPPNGNASATNGAGESANQESPAAELLEVSPSSKLFKWTIKKLQGREHFDAAPRLQPAGVHEITPRLFAPFKFDQGHIHLAGCTLEDRPLIRITQMASNRDDSATLAHHFLWPNGEAVDQQLITQLALDQIQPYEGHLPQREMASLDASIKSVTAEFHEQGEVLAVTVVWCKYAEGKIAFELGDETVYVPFAGWAQLLADGSQEPAPYECPLTDQKTYHLAVTDEGVIAAADGIAVCAESGKRMLSSELTSCAATGKRVAGNLLEACSVSGESVLASALVRCTQCGQNVSPNTVRGGRCSACRSLAPIRKDDPRMARLLDEYPKLDSWLRWRIAETDSVYVLLASSWLRQLAIVVDKQSLEVSHIAGSGRLFTNWVELSDAQRDEILAS